MTNPESNGFLHDDFTLLARAAAWEQRPRLEDCTSATMKDVALAQGAEFATALLYDRVLRVKENQIFFQRAKSQHPSSKLRTELVGIVPGAFYLQHKNTGADGSQVSKLLAKLGCRSELIPLESFGSLQVNAEIIVNWLKRNKSQRIILISLSKGGADLKTALSRPDAEEVFQPVLSWVNLSGLIFGTPLVSWLRMHPIRKFLIRILLRLRGQSYSVVEELRHEPDGPLANELTVTPPINIVNVVGFPLPRQLAHPWASRAYKRVAPFGPNDGGGLLLTDVARLPGTVFPIWGADHYLRPPWGLEPTLSGALSVVLEDASAPFHANQSQNQPNNPPASRSTA